MPDKQMPFSRASIELSPEDLKKAGDLKVGGRVRFILYGTLKELGQSQPDDSTEAGATVGHAVIEVSNLRMASNNEFADLFDDEFDD